MKKIIVMRAIQGAGKSTMASQFEGFTVVSADHHFARDGAEYSFDPTQLGDAHKSCMRRFLDAVLAEKNVVVDNTNISPEEISPYVAVGEALGYDVEIIQIDVDPEVAAARNIHGVPLSTVMRAHKRLQNTNLPRYWKVRHVSAA